MHPHAHERGKQRSNRVDQALTYWLAALSSKSGARAAAVGTTDGLPVAHTGNVDPLELACAGSLAVKGDLRAARREVADVDATMVRLFDGTELVLSLCGAKAPSSVIAGPHLRRIFA